MKLIRMEGSIDILDIIRRSKDDQRQIKRWKGIMNRFKSILIKMVKDNGSKFDYCSISPKIRQIFTLGL